MLRRAVLFFFVVSLAVPAFILPAHAGEENAIHMLVIDTDPKGTNVRDDPKGEVIAVIPYNGKTDEEIEMRAVTVLNNVEDWFMVRLADETEGWMHRSVLGSCSSATEDGAPHMFSEPNFYAAATEIKDGIALSFEYGPVMAGQSVWAKMSYTDASGKKVTGWVPRECLFSNPHNDCRTW
ncbi:hypothetical protein LJC23_02955 [Desulfovibrio sp. OttesenSCG-928-I05]|nr:hypothetical protein [Desulfovibrio sp. OttesenSCG-928-I05]